MKDTVLVTGGAGFLGRHFIKHHLALGDEVTAVDNLSGTGSEWLPGDYERIESDAGITFALLGKFDLAYHFAAPVGGREKIEGDPLYNADSLRLDSLFFRYAVGRVGMAVYPSSSAVYGRTLQEGRGRLLNEEMYSPDSPIWGAPDEMYGFTKMAGEMLAFTAARYGVNTLCIRPFSGYGEGQAEDYPIPAILGRAKRQEDPLKVWGSGQQRRDFIHVDDIVGATVARISAGLRGYSAMNISNGSPLSFIDVAQLASSIVGYTPVIEGVSDKPVGVDSRYGDPTVMSSYYTPKIGLREGLVRVLDAVA